MNYRGQQLRQIIKRDYIPLKQHQALQQTHQTLQFQLNQTLLDVDYQLQVYTKQENEKLKRQIKALALLAEDRKSRLGQEQAALITLAKQKIKNRKEFQEILTQMVENWTQEKADLTNEHQSQFQQTKQDLNLAEGEIAAKNEQIQTQAAKNQKLTKWSEGQHNRILELEQSQQTLTQDLTQSQQDYNLSQQEITHLNEQIKQASLKEQELNKIVTQINLKLANTEQSLQATETKLTQTQLQAQQANQTQQAKINQLQQEKAQQQTRITDLTKTNTEQTQTIANQLEQINQKDAKISQQREVLEQLLANHEQRLDELGGTE